MDLYKENRSFIKKLGLIFTIEGDDIGIFRDVSLTTKHGDYICGATDISYRDIEDWLDEKLEFIKELSRVHYDVKIIKNIGMID